MEKWITVSLSDGLWFPEKSIDLDGLATPLKWKPGKYKIRIGHEFVPADGNKVVVLPISGALEIEILAPGPDIGTEKR